MILIIVVIWLQHRKSAFINQLVFSVLRTVNILNIKFIKKCICLALVILILSVIFLNISNIEPTYKRACGDEIYTPSIASFDKVDLRQTRLLFVCINESVNAPKAVFSLFVVFFAKTLTIILLCSVIISFIHNKDGLKRFFLCSFSTR